MRRSVWRSGSGGGAGRTSAGLSLLVVLLAGVAIFPYAGNATTSAPAGVRVAKASVGVLEVSLTLNGELRATDQLEVTPRVNTRVLELPVGVGDYVQAGEVVAVLDSSQLQVALAQAQATLAKERAALAKLQNTQTRPEDLAKEEAALRAAEAKLAQLHQGPRAEDVAKEETALAAAEAKLAALYSGAAPQDVDIAVQKVQQARASYARAQSLLSTAKEQARIALDQAITSLQATQAQFGASKLVYDEALRTGKDPNIALESCPRQTNGQRANCNELSDAKLRQYKAAYEAAEAALKSAEATVESRQLAYEDAKNQEISGLQLAAAQVQDAQAALDKLRGGGPSQDAVAQAVAGVEAARASYAKATSGPDADVVAKAEADVEAARASLARAQAPVQSTALEFEAAAASVRNAEASVRLAEINLQDANVVAPFSGIVTERNVSVGQAVTTTTTLIQLVSDTIEARMSADDGQVTLLEPGQAASIRLNGFPGVVFPARIGGISPTASTTSRTFAVTLLLDAQDSRLRPGVLAQAEVDALSRAGVLMIPERAAIERATDTSVFVVVDGRARRRVVTLGARGNGMAEVIDGLSDGDTIIIEGQSSLADNDQVSVLD